MQIRWPSGYPPEERKPSISWLTYGMFDRCHRKWLNYNKPEASGEILKWKLIAEKKLLPGQAWAGKVVDDTIDEAIRALVGGAPWPDDLLPLAKRWLREYVRFSREWCLAVQNQQHWPDDINLQPVSDYHFGPIPDTKRKEEVLAKVKMCLDNFQQSNLPLLFKNAKTDAFIFRPQERECRFPWFAFRGVPIYAVFDLMLQDDGKFLIFDWKCGDETNDRGSALEQLHWYAAFAINAWQVPEESIRLVPVWLSSGTDFEMFQVDGATLEFIYGMWTQRHNALRETLESCSSADQALNKFPVTDNLHQCPGCQFRSCEGYARLATATPEDWERGRPPLRVV